ncbi:pentapeptide repeat-containing protein [Streptomyces sp. NPDC051921]|uniref:pentapeptide repeat-containing protein n=1 Tax=Streptomyces sp. NPDC051921 TaxID=3155806 RepID=UPI00342C598C
MGGAGSEEARGVERGDCAPSDRSKGAAVVIFQRAKVPFRAWKKARGDRAFFCRAVLRGAVLRGAVLRGAVLRGAVLREAPSQARQLGASAPLRA